MSKVLVTEQHLEDIADAIRNKNGTAATFRPQDMAEAIDDLEVYPEPTGTKSITENGLVSVKDYEFADVNVPNAFTPADEGKVVQNSALVAQTARGADITLNGTYDTTLNNEVTVNVAGGSVSRVKVLEQADLHANGNGSWYGNSAANPEYGRKLPLYGNYQGDTLYVYGDDTERYIQLSNGNNKTLKFFRPVPKELQTLYVESSSNANGNNWGNYSIALCKYSGVNGHTQGYNGDRKQWRITEGGSSSGSYTDTATLRAQDGGIVTYSSQLATPRQVMEFDLSEIDYDGYVAIYACHSTVQIWNIYAE